MGCPYAIGWFDAAASAGLASYAQAVQTRAFYSFWKVESDDKRPSENLFGGFQTALMLFRRPDYLASS